MDNNSSLKRGRPMSIHCSQGTWRAVGCPHHLHPMQRMQAAASRRHATGQKHVVQGTQNKRFCFWLSIFSCFAKRKNITGELRRNFQLINWLSKKSKNRKETAHIDAHNVKNNRQTVVKAHPSNWQTAVFLSSCMHSKHRERCLLQSGGRHVLHIQCCRA